MTQYITLIDFILFPFVFLIVWRVGLLLRNRYFPIGHIMRPYFVPALLLKVIGSVAFAMVYQFYYGYGDTFGFYNMGAFFTQILVDNPFDFIKIYFIGGDEYYLPKSYNYNFDYLYNHHIATIIVARFSSFIGLLSFGNFILINIGFSIISFSGLWKLFRMFVTNYPLLVKHLAWVILFVPSVIFWGSGLLKDSLTLGALGWLTFACWSLFFMKKRQKSSVFIIMLAIWILVQIKAYILLSFLPPLLIWVGSLYYNKIKNNSLRILVWPIFLVFLVSIFLISNEYIASENETLQLEIITNSAVQQGNTLQQFESGSTYNLGKISPSLIEMLLIAPFAIVTTLFRPFLWEVRNIVMLFSALESFIILILTIWCFIKVGIFNTFRIFFKKSMVFFCLSFSLIFSIGVAISSGNFGTLVRYKLPALPFYLVGLLLVYHYFTISIKAVEKNTSKAKKIKLNFQVSK